jgi:cell division septal protein FtsQ
VRRATVTRQAPSTVAIVVTPREPVAVLRSQGQAWLIDAEAVLVAGGSADGLARIDAPQVALPGSGAEVVDPAVRNALAVHQALPGPVRAMVVRYEAPTETGLRALLHPDLVAAAAEDGLWVRIGAADRIEAKARVIGLLLAELDDLDLDQPVAEIDVRAPDNPVIVPRAR